MKFQIAGCVIGGINGSLVRIARGRKKNRIRPRMMKRKIR